MDSMAIVDHAPLVSQAVHVCDVCRSRKKRCDKRVPICGYCNQRALVCLYTLPKTTPKPIESNISTKRAPVYPNPTPSPKRSLDVSVSQLLDIPSPSIHSVLLLADSLPRSTELTTIDDVLHHQIQYIIRATGRYIDEITVKYFHGIHRWMPVISRRRFHDHLMDARGLYTADFSILLLAMSLITYCPVNVSSTLPDQETLYLSTKMLFAQVQTSIASSTVLIQASILIAVFEYASGRPEAAFMSIEACVNLVRASGSHKTNPFSSIEGPEEKMASEEARNIRWGIMICERLFNYDINTPVQPLAIAFPDIYEYLPSEVESYDENDGVHIMSHPSALTSNLNSNTVGSFGRHAQATYLTDKLLHAICIVHPVLRHAELSKVDGELQRFLSKIMEQSGCGSVCGATSTAIRTLFKLHKSQPGECSKISLATLDTATQLVIDVAHSHEEALTPFDIDSLPPSYTYIVQAALQHMNETRHLVGDLDAWKRDYDLLEKSQGRFHRRWGVLRKSQ